MATPEAHEMNQPLTDFATAYRNGQHIADDVARPINVTALAGTFQKRARKDVNRADMDDFIGTTGTASEMQYSLSTDSYLLEGRGLKGNVDLSAPADIVSAINPEQEVTERLTDTVKLLHERRVATVITTPTNYTSGHRHTAGVQSKPGVAVKWSDHVTADPVGDIKAMIRKLAFAGPDFERVMWMSDEVADALSTHPQILALKGTTTGVASMEELVSYFRGLHKIVVSEATYNSANEAQAAVFTRVWSATSCGIVIVPKSERSTQSTQFAGSFTKKGIKVRTWFDPDKGTDGATVVHVSHVTQAAKVIQDDAGVILSSVL